MFPPEDSRRDHERSGDSSGVRNLHPLCFWPMCRAALLIHSSAFPPCAEPQSVGCFPSIRRSFASRCQLSELDCKSHFSFKNTPAAPHRGSIFFPRLKFEFTPLRYALLLNRPSPLSPPTRPRPHFFGLLMEDRPYALLYHPSPSLPPPFEESLQLVFFFSPSPHKVFFLHSGITLWLYLLDESSVAYLSFLPLHVIAFLFFARARLLFVPARPRSLAQPFQPFFFPNAGRIVFLPVSPDAGPSRLLRPCLQKTPPHSTPLTYGLFSPMFNSVVVSGRFTLSFLSV